MGEVTFNTIAGLVLIFVAPALTIGLVSSFRRVIKLTEQVHDQSSRITLLEAKLDSKEKK